MLRNILVTAISGDIGNGILKILSEREDCVLFGCDIHAIAAGMDQVTRFWQCKYAVEEGYIDELLYKCKENEITHLIPVNEKEIELVSKERKRFIKAGIKILIQSSQVLETCLDKYNTAQWLRKNHFDVPNTYLNIKDISFKTSEKFIYKPLKSNGSREIQIITSTEEMMQLKMDGYILQDYIDSDDEYTMGIFRSGQMVNTIAFKRKLKHGYSSQIELVKDHKLEEIAQRIAELFCLEGYINVQLRKKDGKYLIFEINPRISGTVRFRHMLGFTDVIWWLDLVDGMKIPLFRNEYHRAFGIRELNEKFLIID